MNEERSPWAATYRLDGSMQFGNGWAQASVDLPTTMELSYDPRARTLLLFGKTESGPGLWYGFGLILHLSNERGDSLRRVSLITPRRGGGPVTFSFPTIEPVDWLSLQTGAVSTSPTLEEKYVLTVKRSASSTWDVTLDPSAEAEPEPWFTRGSFKISASSPRPLWDTLTIDFSVESSNGDASGNLRLERITN